MNISNETLVAYLSQCGLDGIRQDIPFEDQKAKQLWDVALSTSRAAEKAMGDLRAHLKMPEPRPGFYCGCCETWHE